MSIGLSTDIWLTMWIWGAEPSGRILFSRKYIHTVFTLGYDSIETEHRIHITAEKGEAGFPVKILLF